jgi:hypothetical protein
LEFSSPSDTLQYQNGVLKKVDPKTYKNRMVFGDVLVDQGYYLAVLSSELNILALEGKQNTERYKATCLELYFAILALDRLDINAEKYLDYTPVQNKFLTVLAEIGLTSYLPFSKTKPKAYVKNNPTCPNDSTVASRKV